MEDPHWSIEAARDFVALVQEYGEPDAWAKLYGDRKGEPLTPLERWTVEDLPDPEPSS